MQAQTSDGRKPGISFRIQPEIKAALEQAANRDHRSVSSLVEKVLAEWLRAHGHLADESPETTKPRQREKA